MYWWATCLYPFMIVKNTELNTVLSGVIIFTMNYEPLSFYLNGEKKEFPQNNIQRLSLLHLLRNNLNLKGTKEGCSEGDCGACTVVVGEYSFIEKKVVYNSVTSCIYPVFKIHNKHIITIEGLDKNGELNPIQNAFIEHHAIQCGFCTPGMIMSMFALLLNNPNPSKDKIEKALSGNLCRCTGYTSIKNACLDVSKGKFKKPEFIKRAEPILKKLAKEKSDTVFSHNIPNSPIKKYILPSTIKSALQYIEKEKPIIINGGTDFMVPVNRGYTPLKTILDLSGIKELNYIEKRDKRIRIGASVTFSRFISFLEKENLLLSLKNGFELIGSAQIRNSGTICGNIANASPIGDSAVILLALNSTLNIEGKGGKRRIALSQFYLDYKKTALKSGEFIESVEFTLPEGYASFIKTSKRKEVDIAGVNSCLILEEEKNTIKSLSIVFGGVAPYPIKLFDVENIFKGKKINSETIRKIAEYCFEKVKPISDVRGSARYRKKLVYNHIIKHFQNLLEKTNE